MYKIYFTIIVVLLFSACADSANPVTVSQGIFIDAPVEGIRFETTTQSGLTNVSGTFNYLPGETVSFYIGDILIGSAVGTERLTPIDFVLGAVDENNEEVTNILRFLQTLDSDANLSNGINISDSAHSALTGQVLDFSLSQPAFEAAFDSINTAVLGGSLIMVTAADAQAHLRSTLNAIISEPAGGDNTYGSLSITGSATDIAANGSTFVPVQVAAGSVWLAAGSSVQLSVRKFEAQVNQVMFTNFGTTGFYQYVINCGSIVAGDSCSNVTVDLVARSITFDNVTLEIANPGDSGLSYTNAATAPIILNGTLF